MDRDAAAGGREQADPDRDHPERDGVRRLGRRAEALLFIQGGPGSVVPRGALGRRMTGRMFRPYVAAGYSVFLTTRRRHMPAGYTVADMAEDFAGLIAEELAGKADLVVGESFGGMIAQYLAALHRKRASQPAEWACGIDKRDIS